MPKMYSLPSLASILPRRSSHAVRASSQDGRGSVSLWTYFVRLLDSRPSKKNIWDTFATDMVDMGLSKAELAPPHLATVTQNVGLLQRHRISHRPTRENAAKGRSEPVLEFSTFRHEGNSIHARNPKATTTAAELLLACPAFKPFIEARHDLMLNSLSKELDANSSNAIRISKPSQRSLSV